MDAELAAARDELSGLREQLSVLENSTHLKEKRFEDQKNVYEEILRLRQTLAKDYITTSVSMGFLDEKTAQAKLNEVASGGSHKGLPKPLQDYFIACTREGEAQKKFEELKSTYEEALEVLKHAKLDAERASERVAVLEQQLNASSNKARATISTVLADSEVKVSKALPSYAVVRSHGKLHADPAIKELKFLMEQMILKQEQTIALIRQEKDAAIAAAQREKDNAIAALRKERDAALSTLMNAQLQVEDMKASSNPYAKVAAGAGTNSRSPSSKGGSWSSSTHHGHGHGDDILYSVSYLAKSAIESFSKVEGPPPGVVRALHDFNLWPSLRRDVADYVLRNSGPAAYNSAGIFIGKPIHPWLRNRAAELGVTVDFPIPASHPGHRRQRSKVLAASAGGNPADNDDDDDDGNEPAQVPPVAHFDGSGIIHAIATQFGRSAWRNPAEPGSHGEAQELVVSRSSDGLYSEPPAALLGQHGAYCFTASEPNQWFCVDFGPKRLVWPVAYTLRHGYSSSTHFLRDWVLEGSIDSENWNVVANHVNDKHLNHTGYAAHTWNVGRECPAAGFRFVGYYQPPHSYYVVHLCCRTYKL